MKLNSYLFGALAALGVTASELRPARADLVDGLGQWRGTGTLFSPEGRALQAFRVQLTRASIGPESVETRGQVTLDSGQVIPFAQRTTRTADGFDSESAHGKGHGHCVGPSVCYSYESDGAGKSSATTVLIDAPDRLRVLVTELEGGQPVRVIWQSLDKQ
jgi:hypothetical protein